MDGERPASTGQRAQEIARETSGQDVSGEAGYHIVGTEPHSHDRNDDADRSAPHQREQNTGERAMRGPGADDRGEGAHQHHALEADGEDAGALG